MREIIRKRIQFTGLVQGVGFRWRAKNAAADLGLTGWVRNEYDGSVTMEMQGSKVQIAAVIDMLERDRWIRITNMEVKELPLVEEERSFRVRY